MEQMLAAMRHGAAPQGAWRRKERKHFTGTGTGTGPGAQGADQ
jgi:hypothetical protein